jgi:type II secretory pathway component PulC
MSVVWREKSVPMTDNECAVEALESVGATILAFNEHQIRIRINGQEWAVQKSHGSYSIRFRRGQGTSLSWMNGLSSAYNVAVVEKARRLKQAEEMATLESERQAIREERQAFEQQRQELIEQRRQEIHEKAKALGYKVKETRESGQVRLVLVRRG